MNNKLYGIIYLRLGGLWDGNRFDLSLAAGPFLYVALVVQNFVDAAARLAA